MLLTTPFIELLQMSRLPIAKVKKPFSDDLALCLVKRLPSHEVCDDLPCSLIVLLSHCLSNFPPCTVHGSGSGRGIVTQALFDDCRSWRRETLLPRQCPLARGHCRHGRRFL